MRRKLTIASLLVLLLAGTCSAWVLFSPNQQSRAKRPGETCSATTDTGRAAACCAPTPTAAPTKILTNPDAMTQLQRECLLDLLILAIFVDSHISLKEDEALQTALDSVGWASLKPREIFICNSMNRARLAADSTADAEAYIAGRASAFADADSQSTALRLIQQVLAGDGESPAETVYLDRVRAAFP